MNRPKAIENPDNVCFKCLKRVANNELNKIQISSLGYGSRFDGWSTQINLCNDCIKETNEEWWKLETIETKLLEDWSVYVYKYENEILEFIKTLPLESQELFWNRYAEGWNTHRMQPQDWIDYELGILPHEKCKEYDLYSPDEIKAYKEKFPICNKVKIVVYDDGSKHSKCPFGAFGNSVGSADEYNITDRCYNCMAFCHRTKEIEELNEADFKIYKSEMQLILRKIKKIINK